MCEITVCNLHDPKLNELLFLIMGTVGSSVKHDDGWGVSDEKGNMFKCGLPMHYTTNSGGKIRTTASKNQMLLGHIRDASAKVPINDKNAHPFKLSDITFVHNGKFNPLKEEDFVMEEEVPDMDTVKHVQFVDKDGKKMFKKVGRSDSLIFFEEFIKDWEKDDTEYVSQDLKFVSVVNTTMSKFYGTFAMVFIINGTFYICRGHSKDLYLAFLLKDEKKDSQILGWAINTSRNTLDTGSILLSNINALNGHGELTFTLPKLLKDETIFKAEPVDLLEIGVLKENYAPVKSYPATTAVTKWDTYNKAQSAANFTKTGEIDELEKVTHLIYNWMEDYALSPVDIQILLYMAYGSSTLEISVDLLKSFYKNVLVKLSNKVEKKTRKSVRKSNSGFVGTFQYEGLNYPWMLNTKEDQKKFIK